MSEVSDHEAQPVEAENAEGLRLRDEAVVEEQERAMSEMQRSEADDVDPATLAGADEHSSLMN